MGKVSSKKTRTEKDYWVGAGMSFMLGCTVSYLYFTFIKGNISIRVKNEEEDSAEPVNEPEVEPEIIHEEVHPAAVADKPDLSLFVTKYYTVSDEEPENKKEKVVEEEPIKVKGIPSDEFGADEDYELVSLSYHDYIDEDGDRVRYLVNENSGSVWSEEDVDYYFGDWDVLDDNIGKEEEDTAYLEDSDRGIYYEVYRADPDYEDLDY